MDQSELLTALVVRGATIALALLVARLLVAYALAAAARVVVDPAGARRLARLAVRIGPRFARGGIVTVTGVALVVVGPGVAIAAPAPAPAPAARAVSPAATDVPVLDRVVVVSPAPSARLTRPPASVRPPSRPRMTTAPPRTHVVRPGESLWSIASSALGRHPSAGAVARSWPRWFKANASVIGSDPARIRPGQALRVPTEKSDR